MIFFGEDSLRRAVNEFLAHYHHERNHQGLGDRLIDPRERGRRHGWLGHMPRTSRWAATILLSPSGVARIGREFHLQSCASRARGGAFGASCKPASPSILRALAALSSGAIEFLDTTGSKMSITCYCGTYGHQHLGFRRHVSLAAHPTASTLGGLQRPARRPRAIPGRPGRDAPPQARPQPRHPQRREDRASLLAINRALDHDGRDSSHRRPQSAVTPWRALRCICSPRHARPPEPPLRERTGPFSTLGTYSLEPARHDPAASIHAYANFKQQDLTRTYPKNRFFNSRIVQPRCRKP